MARALTRLGETRDKLAVLQLAALFTPEFIDTVRIIAVVNDVQLPGDDVEAIELVREACEVWLRSSR